MKKNILFTAALLIAAMFYVSEISAQTDPKKAPDNSNSNTGTVDFKGASFGDPARTDTKPPATRGIHKKPETETKTEVGSERQETQVKEQPKATEPKATEPKQSNGKKKKGEKNDTK